MKKSNLTSRLVPGLLLAALMLTCGTVFAYMFKQTQTETVEFTPAQVSCTSAVGADKKITVTNTSNIDAYLRVRLVSYWVDAFDNIVAKSSPKFTVTLVKGPEETDIWLGGSEETYYYVYPVAPNATVTLGTVVPDESDGDCRVEIDALAEAIQADPEQAAESSWHVTVDGIKITAVP